MKKMILLCAMICAGQLQSMNIDQTIAGLKRKPTFANVDIAGFKPIMGLLAGQYPELSREEIANKFDEPVALNYLEENQTCVRKILNDNAANRLRYLQENINTIDPNYTYKIYNNWGSMLGAAYRQALYNSGDKDAINVVRLLLENGANPDIKEGQNGTLLEQARTNHATRKTDFGLYNLLNQHNQ